MQGGTATTLTTIPVCTGSEMGLLGIAPDPDFATNGFVYLYRTKPAAGGCGSSTGRFNQVVRVTMSGDTVVAGSLTELLTGIRTDGGNHDGGTLRIGPDDKLWVSVGDTGIGDGGAPGQSTNPYSQDLTALEGKILRLELNGSPAAGNPFIGQPPARPEVYARGFRNPFRMSFDDQTGRLWVGDVGQSTLEEIDIVQSARQLRVAALRGHAARRLPCRRATSTPVFEYPRSGPGVTGQSITGGDFLSRSFGFVGGQYVFGDYAGEQALHRRPQRGARRHRARRPTSSRTPAARWTSSPGPTRRSTGSPSTRAPCAGCRAQLSRARRARRRSARRRSCPPSSSAPHRTARTARPSRSPSCNPPVQRSAQLTVGTPDANGSRRPTSTASSATT